MTDQTDNTCHYPSDMCLLLRAHGEHRWLSSEVVPVLHQIEVPGLIPGEQLGAALAYLEMLWIDASARAAETEAAYEELLADDPDCHRLLHAEALHYHDSVRSLRGAVARHVSRLTAPPHRVREHAPIPARPRTRTGARVRGARIA